MVLGSEGSLNDIAFAVFNIAGHAVSGVIFCRPVQAIAVLEGYFHFKGSAVVALKVAVDQVFVYNAFIDAQVPVEAAFIADDAFHHQGTLANVEFAVGSGVEEVFIHIQLHRVFIEINAFAFFGNEIFFFQFYLAVLFNRITLFI